MGLVDLKMGKKVPNALMLLEPIGLGLYALMSNLFKEGSGV